MGNWVLVVYHSPNNRISVNFLSYIKIPKNTFAKKYKIIKPKIKRINHQYFLMKFSASFELVYILPITLCVKKHSIL